MMAMLTVLESERFGDPVMISHLYFPPCPKGRGSPKQKRQGAPAAQKRKGTEKDTSPPFSFVPSLLQPYLREEPAKKRGRPAGSKNKVKLPLWQFPVELTLTLSLKPLFMTLVIFATFACFL